jgi:phage terminase large subunit
LTLASLNTKASFPPKVKFLFEPHRYKVMRGGRGSGKSWSVARALLILGASQPERVLCTREVQESIKESVYTLLKDQIEALNLGYFYEVLGSEIRGLNGTRFLFAGLSDLTAESIKSYEGVTIVWVEEAKNVTKRSWDILVPTIRAKRACGNDSEIWVTYNAELDTDETHIRFTLNPPPKCVSIELNYSDNPYFPSVLEDERLYCQKNDPKNYPNIWEGRCKPAVSGAIYYDEMQAMLDEGRIRNVPYDPLLKVHTIWDIGNSNNMRILMAQRAVSEVRIIDQIAGGFANLAEYVGDMELRKYRWGTDFIPHDGAVKGIQTGKSTEELLQAMGRNPKVIPVAPVEQGIQAAKMLLPRVYVDQTRCKSWIDSMKRYKRHESKTGVIGGPVHDDASHDADTTRYLATVENELYNSDDSGPIKYRSLGYR